MNKKDEVEKDTKDEKKNDANSKDKRESEDSSNGLKPPKGGLKSLKRQSAMLDVDEFIEEDDPNYVPYRENKG